MKTLIVLTSALMSLFAIGLAQTIDPNSVPLATRDAWCTSQLTQCPLICVQTEGNTLATYANDCDPKTLEYDCICSDGLQPNISQYSLTVPYYTCTEFNTQCQTNCGSDNTCAAACVNDHPCGAQNPTRVNTTSSATMSATGTGASDSGAPSTAVYNGFGSSASASSTSNGNGGSTGSGASRLIVNAGQIYGLGVIAAGVFAGFTLLL